MTKLFAHMFYQMVVFYIINPFSVIS